MLYLSWRSHGLVQSVPDNLDDLGLGAFAMAWSKVALFGLGSGAGPYPKFSLALG